MKRSQTLTNSLPLIVQLLQPKQKIDAERFEAIREAQLKENVTVEELLIRKGLASEQEIASAYAEYYLIPLYSPDDVLEPDSRIASLLSEKFCRARFERCAPHTRTTAGPLSRPGSPETGARESRKALVSRKTASDGGSTRFGNSTRSTI